MILMRLYMAILELARPIMRRHLASRLARGKEMPDRWREKLGEPSQQRPDGTLIWIHAVGLGEVMALRGLITNLAQRHPEWSFLVTSTTRQSATVFGQNLPPRTIHQFLPLDAPNYIKRFLHHWRPNLSIWSEQDLWPTAVYWADRLGIPLALINGRMNDRAYAARRRVREIYANLYRRFAIISAQDENSAVYLRDLGAGCVQVDGSTKPMGPALEYDRDVYDVLSHALGNRFVWVLASSHPADEGVAIAAHRQIIEHNPNALLIIAPRRVKRADELVQMMTSKQWVFARRSLGEVILPNTQILLADSYGELGLWYRLAKIALIGGTFDATEGHNPWEAIQLGLPVLHGPRVANFMEDYYQLDHFGAAALVYSTDELVKTLSIGNLPDMQHAGRIVIDVNAKALDKLCEKLTRLVH
jgi:3-deoxy-D-manno-octulosonic-acid transferase